MTGMAVQEGQDNRQADHSGMSQAGEGTRPEGPASGSTMHVVKAVLLRAGSRHDGDELFARLRDKGGGAAAATELGIPTCLPQELDDAYMRCLPHWDKNMQRDIDYIVANIMQDSSNMMDVDKRCRHLQGKVGKKLPGNGRLTEDVLKSARKRCQEHWTRVTPGNVERIVRQVLGKCTDWTGAEAKFVWLWRKGSWSKDKRTVEISGVLFSKEDLIEAEKQCRFKFGLNGQVAHREAGTNPPVAASKPAPAPAPAPPAQPAVSVAPAAAAAEAAVPDGAGVLSLLGNQGAVAAADAPPAAEQTPAECAPQTDKATGADQSNGKEPAMTGADFIVESLLKKCSSMQNAQKFFQMFRSNVGKVVRGRTWTLEDVDVAEKRCLEVWGGNKSSSSSSSSSSSDSDSADGKRGKSQAGAKAAAPAPKKPPESPRKEAGGPPQVAPSSPKTAAEPAQPAAVPGPPQASPEGEPADSAAMVGRLVEAIMRKCRSMNKAEKLFDKIRVADGRVNSLGYTFNDMEITEAWMRCTSEYEALEAKDAAAEAEAEAEAPEASPDADAVATRSRGTKRSKKKKDKEAAAPALESVDKVVEYVMGKYGSMGKAEKFFDKLRDGQATSSGFVCTDEEITEAWLRCSAEFEVKSAAQAPSRKRAKPDEPQEPEPKGPQDNVAPPRKAKDDALSNADLIVRHILRKCDNIGKAEKFFEMLHRTVGKPNPLGRIFLDEDVTEAWMRATHLFEQGGNDESSDAEADDDGASSSESSSMDEDTRKKKKKKGKKKKGKKGRKGMEKELEGALFSEDSDDLSGEEDLDQEDEGNAALMADLAVGDEEEPETVIDDGYRADLWRDVAPEISPGYQGFNKRATDVMMAMELGQSKLQVKFDTAAACPPLQPHQESVQFLLHPKSPVSRLLVDHPTGSGKTREMIRVLDNYFFDPRPKVPIFPKDPVCRNFYFELLRWPSRYRDYFCCERPADAAIASGKPDWREYRFHMWDLANFTEDETRRLCYSIRDVLEMKKMFYMGRVRRSFRIAFRKRYPGEAMPAAPLRALGYTSAGGCYSQISEVTGRPVSAMMKIGFERASNNVYSNKIVLMDEAHNLVRTQTQYAEQLLHLRDLLFAAKNLVLAGFTGTPILNEPTEGRQLLDIVKGASAPEGDEGFLSSFPMRPQPLFPKSLPRGVPDAILTVMRKRQLVNKVELHGESLKIYDGKRRCRLPDRRLRAYCNVCYFYGTFHDGKHGTKVKILTFPEDHCPKLLAIARAVASSSEKAMVMTGKPTGYVVMLELMRLIAAKADPPFAVATMDELQEFNHVSNLRGENFRVLVADAAQCSEGVSFLAVRRTFLADVPVSPSQFIQQCGRAIRMYGHRGLPPEEQTVTTQLYVAQLPKWMRTSSLACWALRAQKKHINAKDQEKRARVLTARLNRAGIRTLTDLKARIDAHAEAKRAALGNAEGQREGMTAEDVVVFLEQNGLWEEAKLLRQAEKKEKAQADAALEARASITRAIEESQVPSNLDKGSSSFMDDELVRDLENVLDEAGIDGTQGSLEDVSMDVVDDVAKAVEGAVNSNGFDSALSGGAPGENNVLSPELALTQALGIVTSLCDEVKRTAKKLPAKKAEKAENTEKAEDAENAENTEKVEDAEKAESTEKVEKAENTEMEAAEEENDWRTKLYDGLRLSRKSSTVAIALRGVTYPEFDTDEGTFEDFTPETLKLLREELYKYDKMAALVKALAVLSDVRGEIEQLETTEAATRATANEEAARAAMVAAAAQATALAAQTAAEEQLLLAKDTLVALPDATLPVSLSPGKQAEGAQSAPVTGQDGAEAAPATAAEAVQPVPVAPAEPASPATAADVQPAPPAGQTGAEAADSHPASPACPTGAEAPPSAEAATAQPDPLAGQNGGEAPSPAKVDPALQANAMNPSPLKVSPLKAGAPAGEADEEAEKAWRKRFETGMRDLVRTECVTAALKVAAPSGASLASLTRDQVKRLHDELSRLQGKEDVPQAKPRALVRAMQQLHLAETAEDPSLILTTTTADEEALRELTERSQEFAPALAAMRSIAVDCEIFAHLADHVEEEAGDEAASESEASDIGKELLREPAPVVLPQGWRLEWVQRGKRQIREFVDPDGIRYKNAASVRVAIERWEAMQKCYPGGKRLRLHGKFGSRTLLGAKKATAGEPSGAADLLGNMFDDAGLEKAFEEALDAAVGTTQLPVMEDSAADVAGEEATEPCDGLQVQLCGLVAKPELNGEVGRLVRFIEETGRWECWLMDGESVNVKPANFQVLPGQKVPRSRAVAKRALGAEPAPSRGAPRRRLRGKFSSAFGAKDGAPAHDGGAPLAQPAAAPAAALAVPPAPAPPAMEVSDSD